MTTGPLGSTRARALVIIPYFGSFGPWFPLYLHSLTLQHTLDLLLITDSPAPPLPDRVRRLHMDIRQVRDLAQAKLGTSVNLSRVRKLCDLKPAYGLVFEDFTAEYEYWAFGDEDVLYGDLDRLLGPYLDGRADIIIPSKTMTIGHLTLVRNAPGTNRLALEDTAYAGILASDQHWAYDEAGRGDSGSFTKAVKRAQARGEVTVQWGFPMRGGVPWPGRSYVYDGRGIRDDDGNEVVYYHWGRYRRLGCQFPTVDRARGGFAFDRYGFYAPALGRGRRAIRQVVGYSRELTRKFRRRLMAIVRPRGAAGCL